jgi:hypothetical protein
MIVVSDTSPITALCNGLVIIVRKKNLFPIQICVRLIL